MKITSAMYMISSDQTAQCQEEAGADGAVFLCTSGFHLRRYPAPHCRRCRIRYFDQKKEIPDGQKSGVDIS